MELQHKFFAPMALLALVSASTLALNGCAAVNTGEARASTEASMSANAMALDYLKTTSEEAAAKGDQYQAEVNERTKKIEGSVELAKEENRPTKEELVRLLKEGREAAERDSADTVEQITMEGFGLDV